MEYYYVLVESELEIGCTYTQPIKVYTDLPFVLADFMPGVKDNIYLVSTTASVQYDEDEDILMCSEFTVEEKEYNRALISMVSDLLKVMTDENLAKVLPDEFVHHDDPEVRANAALTCHIAFLDKLVHDECSVVRKAVASRTRGTVRILNILVHDEDPSVLEEVAKHCISEHLDILMDRLYNPDSSEKLSGRYSAHYLVNAIAERGREKDLEIIATKKVVYGY